MNILDIVKLAKKESHLFEAFKKTMFPVLMRLEGGGKLHNVPGDSGGWTKYGIAYNYWNKYFYNFGDFTDTTEEEAAAFFFVVFFLGSKAHLLPCESQQYYFDMVVNLGHSRSIKYLQQCIGVPADGIIGPITESKMRQATKSCLHKKRVDWYMYLGQRPTQKKFLKGWLNRANYMNNL